MPLCSTTRSTIKNAHECARVQGAKPIKCHFFTYCDPPYIFIITCIYTYMQSLLHAFSIKVIIIFIVSPSENVAAVTPNHTLPNLFHFKLCASLHYFSLSCSSCPHKSFVLGWVALMAATQAFPAPSLQHHLSLVGCSNAYIPALVFFTNIHWLSLMPMLLHSFFLPAFYTV